MATKRKAPTPPAKRGQAKPALGAIEQRLADLQEYLSKRLERRYATLLDESLKLTRTIEDAHLEACDKLADSRRESQEAQRTVSVMEQERRLFLVEQKQARQHMDGLETQLAEAVEYNETLTRQLESAHQEIERAHEELDAAGEHRESLTERLTLAEQQAESSNQAREELGQQLAALAAHRDRLEQELAAIRTGRSWRLTKPLRWLSSRFTPYGSS